MDVLLIGGEHDPQVLRVASELRSLGARFARFDAPSFPRRTRISLSDGAIFYRGQPLPTPRGVYVRALGVHPLMPGSDEDLDHRPRGWIAQCDEKRAALESLLLGLERRGARLINRPEVNAQHSRKPLQLALLHEAGLPVPKWTATNDPAAVRRFVREVKRAVYKPLAGGASVREVTRADLHSERLRALDLAPVLFQERVDGVALRVYVVGGRCVAAGEIHSAELDYRRAEESVAATRLSADERRAALAAARACEMPFTGVDFIRGAGKKFHVLECNPSPMFAVFESHTGTDVAGPLAALLAKRR